MPVGDVVRVRTRGTFLGSRVEFGVHIRYENTGSNAADLAGSWSATIMPLVLAATSAQVNWDEIQVADTSSTGLETFALPLTQPNPGALSGDVLPPANAALISWRTGEKGRRKHGRMYVPGVTETANTNGTLGGAQLTAVQALAAGILTAYGAGGTAPFYRFVIYSPPTILPKPKPPLPVHTDTIVTPVTTGLTDHIVRSQRHRAIGVGR